MINLQYELGLAREFKAYKVALFSVAISLCSGVISVIAVVMS